MKANIFLPETIRVGYNKRDDTYTGKLAYIIYIDEKGVVRKEKSWLSWRQEKLGSDDFKNEPTAGFVLNKKVGGNNYSWNPRNTYTRVYDPRGFEFEIDIPNLLYILENTSSIKGKGLEGTFVYGWQGTQLILIPTDSPDYKGLQEYTESVKNYKPFKIAEMKEGATYKNKQNNLLVYLGRYNEYDNNSYSSKLGKNKGKKFWFKTVEERYSSISSYSNLNSIIACVDETPVSNYAELMDEWGKRSDVSPYDPSKTEYKRVTLKSLEKALGNYGYGYADLFVNFEGGPFKVRLQRNGYEKKTYYYLENIKRANEVSKTDLERLEVADNVYPGSLGYEHAVSGRMFGDLSVFGKQIFYGDNKLKDFLAYLDSKGYRDNPRGYDTTGKTTDLSVIHNDLNFHNHVLYMANGIILREY